MANTPVSLTRILLLCGAVAGPLFIFILLIQDYTRPDYDPRTMLLSLLALGEWGWVQILNFVLAGVLNLLYAVGLWKKLHPGPAGTGGPILIGAYGLCLVLVGVFTTDPINGFPPGAVAPTGPSGHGAIHALGALFTFMTLTAALAVLGRFFLARTERGWASYCFATAIVLLVLFFGGFTSAVYTARTLRLAILFGWLAASLIAIKLLYASDTSRPALPA